MLLFGYSTKCNNTLAQHHCNNIAVTTINADTSDKCNIILHNNTCCTKCNNNDVSYFTIDVIILLITVTAPNAFPDSLFIKSICAHAVLEKFTDK